MVSDSPTVDFLTPEWAAALVETANRSEALREALRGMRLVVAQEVDDVRYAVEFDDGVLRLHWGGTEDADVTFVQSRATAAALSRGETNAQQAFMSGGLRVRGDLSKLSEARDALLQVADALADLRSRTRY